MAELTPGEVVRRAREQHGYAREHLATMAEVSTSMLVRLELRDHIPNVRALGRIVAALDLDITDVVRLGAEDEQIDRRRGARMTSVSA